MEAEILNSLKNVLYKKAMKFARSGDNQRFLVVSGQMALINALEEEMREEHLSVNRILEKIGLNTE